MFHIICFKRKWKHFYSLWREGKQQSLKNVDKNLFRFKDGVRITDVDQNISLPSNVNSSLESPPRKKSHLDFEDLINNLNTSMSSPSPSTIEGLLSFYSFYSHFVFRKQNRNSTKITFCDKEVT